MSESAKRFVLSQLERIGVVPKGPANTNPTIHNEALWGPLLRDGTLGLGESIWLAGETRKRWISSCSD
ncbi:MAG: hypothetical protein MO846_07795 [Candidatus Devosia symbiotica]|nr:hypothetical protein [Candidatus Devosia symbiotica]